MIERYTSKIDTVYTPQQWYEHVSIGVSSVEVVEMKQPFFLDFRQYLSQMHTERNKDEQKKIWIFKEWSGLILEKEKRQLKVN